MNRNGTPPTLPGCTVLPPLETDAERHNGTSTKAKGPTNRRKTAERFATLNAFVDFTAGTLKRNELLVWLVLYRDCRNGIAATSQADIARRAGTSDRTVRRVIRRLERLGLLKTVYRGGLQRGLSKYRVFPLANPP